MNQVDLEKRLQLLERSKRVERADINELSRRVEGAERLIAKQIRLINQHQEILKGLTQEVRSLRERLMDA